MCLVSTVMLKTWCIQLLKVLETTSAAKDIRKEFKNKRQMVLYTSDHFEHPLYFKANLL